MGVVVDVVVADPASIQSKQKRKLERISHGCRIKVPCGVLFQTEGRSYCRLILARRNTRHITGPNANSPSSRPRYFKLLGSWHDFRWDHCYCCVSSLAVDCLSEPS